MPSGRLVAALCAALLLLSACSDDETTSTTTTSPATTSSATTSSTATSSSASSTSATGTVIDLVVSGGSVQGGVQTKDVPLGSDVTLNVTSDVADEVHVHVYDNKAEVAAGGTATMTFTADIPGQFEVELEGAHLKLVELRVS